MSRPSGGSFVGLDIGSQTIKVVEARGSGSSLQISAIGIENTPPGAVQGGVVADPKALGAAIKALLSKSGVGAKRCVSAATGAASVVVRRIEVPRMTVAELAETMKWEVERHIPFAANDVEMSYQPMDDPATPADPNNPNMEVLLAVAQRDMVSQHIDVLTAAGLTPIAIDIEPLAAGRALINLGNAGLAGKNVAVVNIGAANTDVGIFKNSILRFPRTIPLAGDNFTRAISDYLGIPMESAEDEKRQNASIFMDMLGGGNPADFGESGSDPTAAPRTPFDTPFTPPPPMPSAFDLSDEPAAPAEGMSPVVDNPFITPPVEHPVAAPAEDNPFAMPPEETHSHATVFGLPAAPPAPIPDDARARRRREIFDAILPVLGEFATELRRSVDYFRSIYPNDTLDQIILCGGSARLPNLDKFVQAEIGVKTVVADPFAGVHVTSKQMSSERLAEVGPALVVAIGLATRDALLGSGGK